MRIRHVLGIMAALAVAASAGLSAASPVPVEETPLEAQPHMKAALGLLQTAKNQLEKASPDKGGHRVKAIAFVNKAIDEVKLGIEYDNTHSTAGSGGAIELEAQPHMKAALATLEAAKKQLAKASPDKGGHRVKALALVGSAIAETKAGIAYDNTH